VVSAITINGRNDTLTSLYSKLVNSAEFKIIELLLCSSSYRRQHYALVHVQMSLYIIIVPVILCAINEYVYEMLALEFPCKFVGVSSICYVYHHHLRVVLTPPHDPWKSQFSIEMKVG